MNVGYYMYKHTHIYLYCDIKMGKMDKASFYRRLCRDKRVIGYIITFLCTLPYPNEQEKLQSLTKRFQVLRAV